MEIQQQEIGAKGIRFSINGEDGIEIARAFLYIMQNDLHGEAFGLLEDVYVDEAYRSKGIGSKLVQTMIEMAKDYNCYKVIATSRKSRPKVHELYQQLGFEEHGVEFRINF